MLQLGEMGCLQSFARNAGVFALMLVAIMAPAAAAEMKTHKGQSGHNFIFVIGDIAEGDAQRFRRTTATLQDAIVMLESEGGLVNEAIEMGGIIRSKGFATGVINDSSCNSSCGLIWLAGTQRGLSKSARVGFHAAYSDRKGKVYESGVANAMVGRYLTLLDLPAVLVIFATSSPPDGMNWVTARNAADLGIDLSVLDDIETESKAVASSGDGDRTSLWRNMKYSGIYIDHSLESRCFILTKYPDGTSIRIGYSGEDKRPFYFVIQNRNWSSVREDAKYSLRLSFDGELWDMPVKGSRLGSDVALISLFSDGTFFDDMAKAKTLVIKRGDAQVLKANLLGSLDTIKALISCQQTQNAATARDPFADH